MSAEMEVENMTMQEQIAKLEKTVYWLRKEVVRIREEANLAPLAKRA